MERMETLGQGGRKEVEGVRGSQFGAGVATWRPPAWQPIAEQRTMDEHVCNCFERFQRGGVGL